MRKINLTEVALIALLLITSIWGVRQCSSREECEDREMKLSKENLELKVSKVVAHKNLYAIDSVKRRIESDLESIRAEKKRLEGLYIRERDKVLKMPSDTLYLLFLKNRELIGKLYDIDSTALLDIELNRIDLKQCESVLNSCKSESDFMYETLSVYAKENKELMSENVQCESDKVTLEDRLVNAEADKKDLRKKLWATRGIAGGIVLIAILAIL